MKRILLPVLAVLLGAFMGAAYGRHHEQQTSVASERSSNATSVIAGYEPVLAQVAPESDAFQPSNVNKTSAPVPKSAFSPRSKRTIKVPVTKTVYEDIVVEVNAVTPLQQRYSVLMLKRAQRMTDEELEQAITEVEAELQEQDDAATTELNKAIEILEKLQQESDGTPAASRAGQALPILQGNPPPPVYHDAARPSPFVQPANPLPTS